MEAVRSLYVLLELKDNLSVRLAEVNKLIDQTKAQLNVLTSTTKNLTISTAFEVKPDAITNFFTRMDTEVRKATTSLGIVGRTYHELSARVRYYVDAVKTQISKANAIIQEHSLAIAGIGATLTAISYGGFRFLGDATKDLADFQDAMDVFRARVRKNADAILKAMEEASAGTIEQTQLIINANRAIAMGIKPEYLAEMVKIARAAARAQGKDVLYMLESLVLGTARQSKQLLDNLGLQVEAEEAYERYAKAIGKTVNSLTEEEKRQAYINAVLEAGRTQLKYVNLEKESLNETLAKSRVSWAEFKRELAEGALPILLTLVRAMKTVTGWLKNLPEPVKNIIGVVTVLSMALATLLAPVLTLLGLKALGLLAPLAMLKTAIVGLGAAIWGAIAPLLPIIAVVGAIIGAILILQDVLVKGWEKSYLGQFVSWLIENIPFLKALAVMLGKAFDYLRAGIEWLSNVFKSWFSIVVGIFTKLKEIWDNTVGRIIDGARGLVEFFSGLADKIHTILGLKKEISIEPTLEKPEMDKKYYREGSIELNIEKPEIKPEIKTIETPEIESPEIKPKLILDKLRSLILPVKPEIKTIETPELVKYITPKSEVKQISAPITINISGVSDPHKVAELVESRLERKFNAIGVY